MIKVKNTDRYFCTFPDAFFFIHLSIILENYEVSIFILYKFAKYSQKIVCPSDLFIPNLRFKVTKIKSEGYSQKSIFCRGIMLTSD